MKHTSKTLRRPEEVEVGHSYFWGAFGQLQNRTPFQEKLKPRKGAFAPESGSWPPFGVTDTRCMPWDTKRRGQDPRGQMRN